MAEKRSKQNIGQKFFQMTAGACILTAVWVMILPPLWIRAMVLPTAVHELGHLLALRVLRVPVRKIRIGALGMQIESGILTPREELFSALAGPVIGLCVTVFYQQLPREALCALMQSGFNLLPFYPLDGGRALRALGKIRRDPEKLVAKALFSGYNDSD